MCIHFRKFESEEFEENTTKLQIFVVLASFGLIALSIVGAMNANLGLELSDVLPEHTAPAQFLRARDKYFRLEKICEIQIL